jgi:hypothetical protein
LISPEGTHPFVSPAAIDVVWEKSSGKVGAVIAVEYPLTDSFGCWRDGSGDVCESIAVLFDGGKLASWSIFFRILFTVL